MNTNKIDLIKAEVARIQLYTQSEVLKQILDYIDKVQEEPVKIKKGCKYRSICNVTNNDTGNISFVAGKIYLAPEDDTLVSEENGWLCDTSENASNFELVEEPVSDDFEMALAEMIDKAQKCVVEPWVVAAQWKDELIKLAKSDLQNLSNVERTIKEWKEESLSEGLEKAAKEYSMFERSDDTEVGYDLNRCDGFIAGAKWQKEQDKSTIELAEDHAMLAGMEKMKEQMMKDAIEAEIINWASMFTSIKVIEPERAETMIKEKFDIGDKVKLIIVKED